jgi:hypothetical protein
MEGDYTQNPGQPSMSAMAIYQQLGRKSTGEGDASKRYIVLKATPTVITVATQYSIVSVSMTVRTSQSGRLAVRRPNIN